MTREQFIGAMFAFLVTLGYRLLNKYLPPKTIHEREREERPSLWVPTDGDEDGRSH